MFSSVETPPHTQENNMGVSALRNYASSDMDSATAPEDESWKELALCAQTDPEAFFPDNGSSVRDAKRICLSCGVQDRCLDYALTNEESYGVWGGLSERERHILSRAAN
jgi:WhiB family redox-sensing transcriptional regulator